jgi:cell division control protein 24
MEVAPPVNHARSHTPSSIAQGRYPAASYMATPAQQTNGSGHYSNYSQPSSLRSSDSTQATSASTLFNPPPLPTPTPSSVLPFGNESVLNVRGEKEKSLFQQSLSLRSRLNAFPGFEDALREEEMEIGEDADPVTIMWRFFRRGYPLMELYNALNPRVRLEVDPNKVAEKKRGQAATFKFIHACMKELNISECFMVTDLYGDDTTGFVKVGLVAWFQHYANGTGHSCG